MDYKLLKRETADLLEQEVNRFISLGWEPFGGVAVSKANNGPNLLIFVQAMVRHRKS